MSFPRIPLFKYALTFLVSAIIAGVFAFSFLTGIGAVVAKVCFVVLLLLAVASLMYDPARRRSEI